MRNYILLVSCMMFAAGCYASSSRESDSASDERIDPVIDSHTEAELTSDVLFDYPPDHAPDVPPDIPWDPRPDRPPDIHPDYPPDIPPICEEPEEIWISWMIDGTVWPWEPVDIYERCRFDYLLHEEEGHIEISMTCMAENGTIVGREIVIDTYPPTWPQISPGDGIILRYVSDTPFWANRWFSLSYESGGLIMAGVDAESLDYPDVDTDDIFSPLNVSPVTGLCPLEPMDCFDRERLALDFSYLDSVARVFDHGEEWFAFFEVYHILVENASRRVNIRCVDTPSEWYTAFIAVYMGD